VPERCDPSWDERYAALCDHAHRIAVRLLADGDGRADTASGRYLLEQSARLAQAHVDGGRPRPDGPAADALDAVALDWPAIRAGTITGETVFERRPDLWRRLMGEWPMVYYAEMVTEALFDSARTPQTVVELGAGVGVTTRRLRRRMARWDGRVVATDLRYTGAAADFDRRLLTQVPSADAVVATNALHCARDPALTLGWVREVLRPGGVLVLGEGAPCPEPGVPWALNLLFGACRGWYDRGGFRSPAFWLDALRQAGFDEVERRAWPSERYELGGAFIGRLRP